MQRGSQHVMMHSDVCKGDIMMHFRACLKLVLACFSCILCDMHIQAPRWNSPKSLWSLWQHVCTYFRQCETLPRGWCGYVVACTKLRGYHDAPRSMHCAPCGWNSPKLLPSCGTVTSWPVHSARRYTWILSAKSETIHDPLTQWPTDRGRC